MDLQCLSFEAHDVEIAAIALKERPNPLIEEVNDLRELDPVLIGQRRIVERLIRVLAELRGLRLGGPDLRAVDFQQAEVWSVATSNV